MQLPLFVKRAVSLVAALALILQVRPAPAQQPDAGGDEADQVVARVAFLTGDVSYNRGDDPDDWQPAALNFPMTQGDRLFTTRGAKTELQTDDATVFLGSETELSSLAMTDGETQLSIAAGTATFHVHHLSEDGSFEIGTPNASITFDTPGSFRISVDANGNTRVIAQRGKATVAAGGGQVRIEPGDEIDIAGLDNPRYDVVDASVPDAWDQWVESRARAERGGGMLAGASQTRLVGMAELDREGRWQDIPSYGHVWTPNAVEVDWAPYRVGHWAWVAPWGWTWVSSEAWGWAPYHYGRWVTYSSRWYWVPEAPAAHVRWSPALVAFVGAGPGWSANISVGGGGYVGWFPLAPRDPFVPWWGHARANVSVTNVTYVNRNYVTVVNHETFVSSAPVVRNVVHDAAVVKQVSASPVVRGPIPAAPTNASLRVSGASAAASVARPPATVLARAMVTKNEPPPPKAHFAAGERKDDKQSAGTTVVSAPEGSPARTSPPAQAAKQLVSAPNGNQPAQPPMASTPAAKQSASTFPTPAPARQAVSTAPAATTTKAVIQPRTVRPIQVQQAGKQAAIALTPHENKAPRRQVEPLSEKRHPKAGPKEKKNEPAPGNENKK
jgi:hypothetical protein